MPKHQKELPKLITIEYRTQADGSTCTYSVIPYLDFMYCDVSSSIIREFSPLDGRMHGVVQFDFEVEPLLVHDFLGLGRVQYTAY